MADASTFGQFSGRAHLCVQIKMRSKSGSWPSSNLAVRPSSPVDSPRSRAVWESAAVITALRSRCEAVCSVFVTAEFLNLLVLLLLLR